MTRRLAALAALLLVSACSNTPIHAKSAAAKLEPTVGDSASRGTAHFEEVPGGVLLFLQIENATPGLHGFHIHQNGSCADSGKAAGDHFNPANAPHGKVAEAGVHGAHAGDFGNILIGTDGTGTLEAKIPGLTITEGEFGVLGRTVVFHAAEDKFTQPAGDAGARIACGVVEAK